jgi:hypothetical protein
LQNVFLLETQKSFFFFFSLQSSSKEKVTGNEREYYTVNKVGEIGGKEETDDNGNECNPAADITSQVPEQKLRQVESNVGDQQSCEQVCPPVCPVQYQQISAKNGTKCLRLSILVPIEQILDEKKGQSHDLPIPAYELASSSLKHSF